jgi:hypothetical protein
MMIFPCDGILVRGTCTNPQVYTCYASDLAEAELRPGARFAMLVGDAQWVTVRFVRPARPVPKESALSAFTSMLHDLFVYMTACESIQ